MSRIPRFSIAVVAFSTALALSLPAAAQFGRGPAGPQRATTVQPLQFHYMGPAPAGRVASAAGVAGDPSTYYLGSASGGLWKSTDGGHSFMPIFDKQDAAAIGTIAVAPSDPNTVWVGTGEPWVIRPADIIGDGVYKSSDAGATWQHMGLVETGRIARIVVNPKDINNVFVCAEGRLSSPQQQRGVFRSTDGGQTWEKTLFVNEHTGCSGLSMDPADPNTLVAGTWQVSQRTWDEASGGDGSGVYLSHDNGLTWTHATNGLPKPPVGKIDVAFAPSNPLRIYALIQTADQGSMWRSDDGGQQWQVTSWDRSLIGRAGYYIRIAVNPKDDNGVLVTSSSVHYSRDGGKTFSGDGGSLAPMGPAGCGDCHDSWIDPTNPARYILTDDGGASIATGAGTALHVSLPNGQMYHVASDNQVPYWIYSNRQDDGTMRLVSTTSEPSGQGMLPVNEFMPEAGGRGRFGGFGRGRGRGSQVNQQLLAQYPKAQNAPSGWAFGPNNMTAAPAGRGGFGAPREAPSTYQADIGGCESGFTIPDPTDANIVWATCYGNKLTRFDNREGSAHSVEPSEITLDSPPNQVKYRCHWTSPLAIDPFNHNRVIYGCQMVLMTQNDGHSWSELSPDLSTKDPSRIVSNGGIEGDNLAQYDGEVVWSLAYSPIQRGLLWAGTNDGKLWYTRDAEQSAAQPHWVDVTANLHLPPWGEINQIAPSSFDPATAYVAVDFRMSGSNDYKPYLLQTTDYGATWKNIDGDIPASNPLDYILSVAENPNRKGMLFAGSAHAFYYSLDDGGHWVHFNQGLPPSPVSWINVEKRFHDVDVSTYGRGLYILPDITSLEQSGSTATPAATELFKPADIFRKARGVYPTGSDPARPQFLFNLAQAPTGPAKLEILQNGKEVRTESVNAHQGLNGASWNLLYDPPTLVQLRTTPPQNPHIWEEPRFQGKSIRTITHWGITPNTGIPLAAPGSYQIRLTVDGQTFTRPFNVLKDPAITTATTTQLQASTAMQVRISGDITETSQMVNRMEIWRRQIEDQIKADPAAAAAALTHLNSQILVVENQLTSPESRLSDDKHFPTAYKVYMNLVWLSGGVGQGASDEAGGVDYPPTAAQIRTLDKIETQMATARNGYNELKSATLPAFNKSLPSGAQPITDTPGAQQ
ncbi:MAG: WD40/YVTN/BNR-like repeat-containing protein [Terriglobales bacterium]